VIYLATQRIHGVGIVIEQDKFQTTVLPLFVEQGLAYL
jgi:hypothetical protein